MFTFLKQFDEKIYNRYLTLETNIKSKSTSFYDSWLDLLESFIVYMFDTEHINYDKRMTCGQLLRDKAFNVFLIERLMYNKLELDTLKNKVSSINDHKHHEESTISLDNIYKTLDLFFILAKRYAKYKNIKIEKVPNIDYYVDIYGVSLREHDELNKTNLTNKEILDILKNMDNKENLGIETNPFNFPEFARTASQHLFIIDTKEELKKSKKVSLIYSLVVLSLITINLVLNIIINGFLDTFSFFNLLWALMILIVMKNLSSLEEVEPVADSMRKSMYKIVQDDYGVFSRRKVKLSYSLLFIISVISTFLIPSTFLFEKNFKVLTIIVMVLEVITAVLMIFHYYSLTNLFGKYYFVYLINYHNGQKLEYIYEPSIQKYYLKSYLDNNATFITDTLNKYIETHK